MNKWVCALLCVFMHLNERNEKENNMKIDNIQMLSSSQLTPKHASTSTQTHAHISLYKMCMRINADPCYCAVESWLECDNNNNNNRTLAECEE